MGYPFRITEATLDVIEVLMTGDDHLYGLKIAKQIGRPTGSVFPILMRLEDCGWVTSEWEEGDSRGPRRRFYRLHPDCLGEARTLLASKRGRAAGRSANLALRPGWEGGL